MPFPTVSELLLAKYMTEKYFFLPLIVVFGKMMSGIIEEDEDLQDDSVGKVFTSQAW